MGNYKLDPTGHFKDIPSQHLVETLGLLPTFALGNSESIAENMQENYAFFSHWSEPGLTKIDEHGVWSYPEDEDLYPILSMDNGLGEVVYIYQHAIVAVTVDGKFTKWTRMD